MTSLFISYSRKDIESARKLTEKFKDQDWDYWIDWEDIPPTVDWWKEIEKGIEEAGVFLFLISPDSARSKICKQEINHAVKNGKRLIPIVVRDLKTEEAPSELVHLNWIFFRESDDFNLAFDKLITAIRTDYDWVQAHRQLQVKALEWERSDRENSFLLRGRELQDAELQLAANSSREPHPTDLQREYVLRSRQATDRQRRITSSFVFASGIVLVALAVFGWVQAGRATVNAQEAQSQAATAQAASTLASNNAATAQANAEEAQKQARISRSGELAAQSAALREKDFLGSLLLGVEALYASDTIQARIAVMENFYIHPNLHSQLWGHTELVSSMAFSPDGKMLASGNSEGIFLWEVATGKQIGELPSRETEMINSVVFSSDGKTLASGGEGAVLWNLETGQLVRRLGGDTTVRIVTFSPDGKILASTGEEIILWDVETGQPVGQPLKGHINNINCVVFSPDGKTLASGGSDSIILWDARTGTPIAQLQPRSVIESITFSPDGKTLVSAGEDLILWNVETGESMGQPQPLDPVGSVAFTPDGKRVATGGYNNIISLWDVETGQRLGQLPGNAIPETVLETSVDGITFSPDGKILAAGYWTSTIILWDLGTEQPIEQRLRSDRSIKKIIFSPDGKKLISGGEGVTWWDVETGELIDQPLGVNVGSVNSVAVSPDGKILASDRCARFDNNGSCTKGEIILWDMATGAIINPPLNGHDSFVISIAFSPDGKTLASGGLDGTIIVWDVETRKSTNILPGDNMASWISKVVFSPDGNILAFGGRNITLWDVKRRQPIGQIMDGLIASVDDLAFSPDGKILAASCDTDWIILLWDVGTGQLIGQPLDWGIGFVSSLTFSPDGKMLASGHTDNNIILWDMNTGQQIGQPIRGTTSNGDILVFRPDGKMLASSSQDNTIILWDLDPSSWIQKTCRRAGRNFTLDEWERYFQNEEIRATCPYFPLEPKVTPVPRGI